MGFDYSLSPSKLGILRDCPLCFWLHCKKKLERPRGVFPSLPGGVDRVMKSYCDQFRGSLPPELVGQVPGKLWGTVSQMNKLRNWRSGLKAEVRTVFGTASLIGALDDLLVTEDGGFAPLDGKTKGDVPKDNGAQYYQAQLDCYALMLQENGMPPTGSGYLWYFWPVSIEGGVHGMRFDSTIYELRASAQDARDLIEKAMGVLTGEAPQSAPGCEHCKFSYARAEQALTMAG